MNKEEVRRALPERPLLSDEALYKWWCDIGEYRKREVLTYRKVRESGNYYRTECTCSYCHETLDVDSYGYMGSYPSFFVNGALLHNGSYTTCPCCGHSVEVAYYTRLRNHPIISTQYPMEIRSENGCAMFVSWELMYEIDEYGPVCYAEKRNAYVLDPDGKWHRFTAMERSGWYAMSKMEYIGQWYPLESFQVVDGASDKVLPFDAGVLDGTYLENAKVAELARACHKTDLLQYARMYVRHKEIENLVMNCPEIVGQMIRSGGVNGFDWIAWKKRKPHQMLFLEKEELKELRSENGGGLAAVEKRAACAIWGVSKEFALSLSADEAGWAIRNRNKKDLRKMGLIPIINWFRKMRKAVKGAKHESWDSFIKICEDYWADLRKVSENPTRLEWLPANVTTAHARVIEEMKYKEDPALIKKFNKIMKKIEPLAWESGRLMIRPAKSEGDLIAEGKILDHCVGGYGKEHCAGKSIFFIRKKDQPEEPFYTLQLDTKTGVVLQNRGLRNCARTEEVREFENSWLRQVVKPWLEKKHKERKTA